MWEPDKAWIPYNGRTLCHHYMTRNGSRCRFTFTQYFDVAYHNAMRMCAESTLCDSVRAEYYSADQYGRGAARHCTADCMTVCLAAWNGDNVLEVTAVHDGSDAKCSAHLDMLERYIARGMLFYDDWAGESDLESLVTSYPKCAEHYAHNVCSGAQYLSALATSLHTDR